MFELAGRSTICGGLGGFFSYLSGCWPVITVFFGDITLSSLLMDVLCPGLLVLIVCGGDAILIGRPRATVCCGEMTLSDCIESASCWIETILIG